MNEESKKAEDVFDRALYPLSQDGAVVNDLAASSDGQCVGI